MSPRPLRCLLRLVAAAAVALLVAGAVHAVDEEAPEWLAPLPEGVHLELPELAREVPSPREVLGSPLGTRFHRWEEARSYLERLADVSGRVTLRRYGESYEGRPLLVAAITSEENQARLDEIRRNRLRLADPESLDPAVRERLLRETPIVVWLGYGIHGNETSSTEAALGTAYVLAAARDPEWREVLRRAVVLIDPLQNPDGRERYLAAYQQRRGREPSPNPEAAEHREPWPRGRGNHYLFDLNRDWAWATQVETRYRLTEYRRWEPQVFVDLHEMSARSEYFFPPPTEPVHAAISPQVLRWLDRFGRANAAAFDRAGWLYFKAEAFDLFYPGYGDSYPSLRGAVGMTYEVGGGGRAGEVLALPDGSLLTLADRLARHLAASLATVEAAAEGHDELARDFLLARTPDTARPKTYLWPDGQPEARALVDLLRLHGIEVARLGRDETLRARRIGGDRQRATVPFAADTWAVSTTQPLGRLVRALLDPDPSLPAAWLERQRQRAESNLDAEFFDVTAWSPLLAFGLEAWVHDGTVASARAVHGELSSRSADRPEAERSDPVGWVGPWRGVDGYRAAVRLLGEEVPLRLVRGPVEIAGGRVAAGSLFAPRLGSPPDLAERLELAAGPDAAGAWEPVADTYGEIGTSLGSDRVIRLMAPRIGLVGGDGVSASSFGALWSLFDRLLEAPVVRLARNDVDRSTLGGLDVLILPNGDYSAGRDAHGALTDWVRDGGTLIAVGDAHTWLAEHGLSAIRAWPDRETPDESRTASSYGTDDEPAEAESPVRDGEANGDGNGNAADATEPEPQPTPVERRLLDMPGAIVATRLSPGHPLAAGLPAPPPVLFRGDVVWRPTGDPQMDVLTVREDDPVLAGFAWTEAQDNLRGALLVASEPLGSGRVVLFAQDPVFRGFWRATMPLLLNAALYGPSGGLDPAAAE